MPKVTRNFVGEPGLELDFDDKIKYKMANVNISNANFQTGLSPKWTSLFGVLGCSSDGQETSPLPSLHFMIDERELINCFLLESNYSILGKSITFPPHIEPALGNF